MSASEDEDLERAIALSLGKPDPVAQPALAGTSVQDPIHIGGDEETTTMRGCESGANKLGTRYSSGAGSILGLNRKKMEEERLARKRRRPSHPQSPKKFAKLEHLHGDHGPFPRGVVKRTWVYGHERAGDDINLEEVLEAEDLQLAVFSSFQWDIPWMLGKINMTRTKVTLVMQAKDQATRTQHLHETSQMDNLRLCFPPMEGQINCMHSKLMLLSYPNFLRIAIPTANLVRYDWGETGEMENTVFLIDLPRLPGGERVPKEDLSFFGRELEYFLEATGLDQAIIDSLCAFDFAATKGIALVHTIGGEHAGETWRRTGYCGLGRAVKELKLASLVAYTLFMYSKEDLSIDFLTSSVGSLDMGFLARIYAACQGEDGLAECTSKSAVLGKTTNAFRDHDHKSIEQGFRIYFPSHETVTSSTAGYAGTICIQPKYYNNPKFPQHLMRDCKSVRKGVLMHNKIMYVRSDNGRAWAYVGSANCSESAWGNKLVKDRATKLPKLNCRNWECGVLIPAGLDPQGQDRKSDVLTEFREPATKTSNGTFVRGGLQVFKDSVPVPMQYPGEEYQGKKPWYFQEDG